MLEKNFCCVTFAHLLKSKCRLLMKCACYCEGCNCSCIVDVWPRQHIACAHWCWDSRKQKTFSQRAEVLPSVVHEVVFVLCSKRSFRVKNLLTVTTKQFISLNRKTHTLSFESTVHSSGANKLTFQNCLYLDVCQRVTCSCIARTRDHPSDIFCAKSSRNYTSPSRKTLETKE